MFPSDGVTASKGHAKPKTEQIQNRSKIFDEIVTRSIKAETIESSVFYPEIRERVNLLPDLEEILDSNDTIFKYSEDLYPYSKIKADFLLDNQHSGTRVFVFLSPRKDGTHFCKSFFPIGITDFSRNQQRWTLLKKVKRHLTTGNSHELYHNPHYKEAVGEAIQD